MPNFQWLIDSENHSRKIRELFNITCKKCGKVSCFDEGGCQGDVLFGSHFNNTEANKGKESK